jgi:hypothetical protein
MDCDFAMIALRDLLRAYVSLREEYCLPYVQNTPEGRAMVMLDQYEKEVEASKRPLSVQLCDATKEETCCVPGCDRRGCCGMPTPEGYKWFCRPHYPAPVG